MLKNKSKEEKQAFILTAAKELFAQQGYGGTTIDEIAAKANIGKGSVYNSFQNKEQLFFTIVCTINQPFTNKLQAISDDNISPIEKINQMAYEFLMFYKDNADIWIILVEEMKALSFLDKKSLTTAKQLTKRNKNFQQTALQEAEFLRYQGQIRQTFAMLKNAIQEGIQQKMFRDQSADATACSFFAVLMLLAFTGYIQDPAEDAANMANNFLYGIVTPTPNN